MNAATMTKALTGKTVLSCLLAAFGVIATVNGTLIMLALDSFSGETEAKSYAAGLDYNRTLERVEAQKRQGWQISGGATPMEDGSTKVAVTFVDSAGQPIEGLSAVATFSRPTQNGLDFDVALAAQGKGLYTASTTPPLPGRWHVRISASRGDEPPFIADFKAPKRKRAPS